MSSAGTPAGDPGALRAVAARVAYSPGTGAVLLLAVLAVFALWPLVIDDQLLLRRLYVIGLFALIAMGLNVSMGRAGELFLGVAGLFAASAYISGALTTHEDFGLSPVAAAPITIVATVLLGVAMGLVGLRVSAWYFAIVTFYFAIVIPEIATGLDVLAEYTGGGVGLFGVPRIEALGHVFDRRDTYWLLLAVIAGVYVLTKNLFASPWGLALATMRHSDVAVQALGASTVRAKMLAYVFASVPAALAGIIWVHTETGISGGAFPPDLSFLVAASIMFGGMGTLMGPLVGTGILRYVPQFFDAFERYELIIYGSFLILGMVLIPRGVVHETRKWFALARFRLVPPAPRSSPPAPGAEGSGVVRGGANGAVLAGDLAAWLTAPLDREALSATGVSKSFGGVTALRNLDFEAAPGRISALIGPNGSGKTTFLNLVLGYYRLDSGAIRIDQREISRLAPHRRVHAGIARTFQAPNVVPELTALENVLAGTFMHRRATLPEYLLRLPHARAAGRASRLRAQALLAAVGLEGAAELPAGALPSGQQRLLDVARALATRPRVLLLDEPASGLSGAETEALGRLLSQLRTLGLAIVLVEHNVPFVMSVADSVTVLDGGERIALGPPDEVQRDPAVIASYLGEQFEVDAGGPDA